MDELDIAQQVEEMQREKALHDALSPLQEEKKRLELLRERGLDNRCKYCDEVLDDYNSAFCPNESGWSCREEWMNEQQARKRNGK